MGKTTELGKKRAHKAFHVTLEAPDENEQVCIQSTRSYLCAHIKITSSKTMRKLKMCAKYNSDKRKQKNKRSKM